MVAPIGKGATITYTKQVKQNAQGTNVSTGNVGKPKRVSEPDAGVAIAKEVQRDTTGKVTGTFAPAPCADPAAAGRVARSSPAPGLDPTTGASLQVRGTVKGPDRVTGCSEFIQGIRADATVTSQGVPSQAADTVEEVFTIETQTGGLVVGTAQTPTNSKITTDRRRRDPPDDQAPRHPQGAEA